MTRRGRSASSSDSSSSDSSDSSSDSSAERKPRQNKQRTNTKDTNHYSRSRKRTDPHASRPSQIDIKKNVRKMSSENNRSERNRDRKRSRSPLVKSKDDKKKDSSREKSKNLFPIVSDKVHPELEAGTNTITETTLVSYPNLNSSITERNDERIKSMSSTVTIKYNPQPASPLKRRRPSPSLRERVGWDPFQGAASTRYGDHDDRQLSHGYNDSYTRKDGNMGARDHRLRGAGRRDRRNDRNGGERPRGGGLWSNNRNFIRNNTETADRSGMFDKKWKRDLFSED